MTSSSDRLDGRRLMFAVLAGFTLLHLVLAVSLPLSGDEIYYRDCSSHAVEEIHHGRSSGSQSAGGRGPDLTSNRVARPSSVTSTRMSRPSQAKR